MNTISYFDEPLPAVGIFWYDPEAQDLFGVYKKELTPRMIEDAAEKGLPFINYQSLHQQVWQKQYFHAVAHHEPSKFAGDYSQVPRGRVSWCIDHFVVLVGRWAQDIEDEMRDLLRRHFAVSDVEFYYDEHMD